MTANHIVIKTHKTKPDLFKKVMLWILLAAGVIGAAYTLSLIVRFASSPNQMDFGEGFSTYIAQLWANGQFHWQPDIEPYMTLIYGTIYPTLMAPFVHLFGPDLRIGRVFSILATAVIAFLIYLIAKRYTKNRFIPFIAALLPFTYSGYQEWIMQTRCDMTAIMFETIGLYLAIRFWNQGKKVLWCIPFILLAFFTKQSEISVGIAIGIALLISNRQIFMRYLSITVGSLSLIILIGNLLTGGQFWKQLTTYNVTTPFFNYVGSQTLVWFMIIFPLIFLFIMAAAYVVKKFQARELNLPVIWVTVAVVLNSFAICRFAGFVNYAMEMVIAMGLVTALYFDTKISQRVLISGLLVFQLLLAYSFYESGTHFIIMPDKGYQERINKVQSIIQDAQYPILTEHAGLMLNAGKVPYYEPFIYTQLIYKGYFPEDKIVSDLQNQKIEYIVLQSPGTYPPRQKYGHLTLKMMDEIKENYTIVYNTYDEKVKNQFWYSFTVYEANDKLRSASLGR